MIDASLASQKAIFGRLTAANVLPAGQIFDKGGLPAIFPCIIIGAGQTMFPDYYTEFATRVVCDVHIWTDEDNLASVKQLAGQVRESLFRGPWEIDGHRCSNLRVETARFLRDPDGKHSHCVLSVTLLLQEVLSV